jgi:two-component system nitrogen regulation response regulator GlnG
VDSGPALLGKARGGTLLFDEIGDLPDEAQARIVRMLDSLGDSAPRIMATSQQDLLRKVEDGAIRQDLYYRLNGVTIPVPPLRDRVEDIPLLADHFLAKAERDGAPSRRLSADAEAMIRAYSWPGNVRQLEHSIRRLVVTSTEAEIGVSAVTAVLSSQPEVEPLIGSDDSERLSASVHKHLRRYFDLHGGVLPARGLYQRILREVEVPLIEISLEATGGNQAKCADLLGINRNTLRKKITELDIHVTRRRKLM